MNSSSSAYSMPSSRHFSSSATTDNNATTSHAGANSNKLLQESKAFRFGGFETINDKVLREMNERAKNIINTSEPIPAPEAAPVNRNYEQIPTILASSHGQHEPDIGISAAAEDANKKRYTSIHSRRFAKMDSITSHYAAKNHPMQFSSDQISNNSNHCRNYSNTSIDYSTSKVESKLSSITISPSKRVVNKLFSIAPKRRRVDQHGNMIEVENPAARLFGFKASPRFSHHLDHTTGSSVDNTQQQNYSRNGVERPNLVTQSTPSKFTFSSPDGPSLSAMTSSSPGSGMSRYDSAHKYSRNHHYYNNHHHTPSHPLASSRRHLSSSSSSSRISLSSSSTHAVGTRQLSSSKSSSSLSSRFDVIDTNIPRLALGARSHSLNSASTLSSGSNIKTENIESGHPVSTSSFGSEHHQQQHQQYNQQQHKKGHGLGRTGSFSGNLTTLKSMIPRSTSRNTLRKEPSSAGRTWSLGQRKM